MEVTKEEEMEVMGEPDSSVNLKCRLSMCEVCNANTPKYSCPKCEVKTCCLTCVKIHKKELECDGIRDRTKFIYAKDFTSMDLQNDYRLLEECSRFVYGKQRNKEKKYTAIGKHLPHHLSKLKRVASSHGTVLLFLPENFTQRRANNTRVMGGHIQWCVELLFPNARPAACRITTICNEQDRLATLLQPYLNSSTPTEETDALVYYQAAGLSGVRIFLKAERVKGSKYHELDTSLSLRENLAGKCVVEYPILVVFLLDHAYHVSCVDSDDEIDVKPSLSQDKASTDYLQNISLKTVDVGDQAKNKASACEGSVMAAGFVHSQDFRKHHRELATVKFAREEKRKIEKEIVDEQKKKPKNLLFVTGYSSDEASNSDC